MNSVSPPQALLVKLASYLRVDDAAIPDYLEWLQARFGHLEPGLQAFLPEPDRFNRLQEEADELVKQYPDPSQRPKCFGLPFGVKDIFHVQGFETHAGSQLPPQVLAGDQAVSVSRLRQSGALVLGKTVTTEFAYFAPGPTTNPHHPGHTPGGSSSGSAAAVAAGLAPLALGTQTIGSINRPASFCGVVGYKPTYARIPARGVIPLSPSLDHVGFFTPDAASAAWIASVLVDDWDDAEPTVNPLRLGIPNGPYLEHAGSMAMSQFETDQACLRDAGHDLVEIPAMPDFEDIVARHNLILAAEASRVHQSWYAGFTESYHPKTAELIRLGETISGVPLQKALLGRMQLRSTLEALMDTHKIDVWITPSAPGPAPEGLESTGDPVMNLPWTHSGLPTVTLPSGQSPQGLPLGLQVIGRADQDERLLAWAGQLEGLFSYEGRNDLRAFLDARSRLHQ
jgi:Asp-tRNA(Asn)/Glu-tRNA(Gln) amidotransferase A subunit family amidase